MTSFELLRPEELPGIDLEAGLLVTQHNENLYRKLLLKFYEKSNGLEQTFRDLIDQGLDQGLEQARLEAHSLKGVAGNLGMHGLHELSLVLEKACAENQAALINQSFANLVVELNKVLTGISKLQTQVDVAPPAARKGLVATDLSMLTVSLDELIPLLEANNFAAKYVVKKLAPILNNTNLEADFIKLKTAIDGYNFDLALEIASVILQQKSTLAQEARNNS